jgi:hypothetical protein
MLKANAYVSLILLHCSIPPDFIFFFEHLMLCREMLQQKGKRGPLVKNRTSRSPNSNLNTTHQSNGAPQTSTSSQTQSQAAISITSSIIPHATKHAGRWVRFCHFVCCTSPENIDDHHDDLCDVISSFEYIGGITPFGYVSTGT